MLYPGYNGVLTVQQGKSIYWMPFLLALVFAILLTSLPVDQFVDRDNYLMYAGNSIAILLLNASQGIGSVLTNEPLWLLTNILLSSFLEPEACVRTIIAFSSFCICYVMLRARAGSVFILLLFLLLPQVLKNYVIHLRQGMAISVFMIGWLSDRKAVRNTMFTLVPFIHASFFFIIGFIVINKILAALRLSATIRLIFFVAIGLFLSFASIWLAAQLGARQGGEYKSSGTETSGLGFIFWTLFAAIFVFQGAAFLKRHAVTLSVLVFYLASYFFLPVSARIFESALLIILLASLELTTYRRTLFLFLFSFYFFAQWSQRVGLPGAGWGIENYL